ncbi:hypothetical protein TraAM80_04848 [Trypanosoma rangeli]|uniref:Uncharacterized protein n=1 Tax=Trypanosoma rangeli TaxID=5698 RepID=A0A3R7KN94_TRYRA|nr:uncharacterized protein TraAM80_04848 [Trypanosoma rangeli]RNF05119.1 hypothetical protein TraAM80_04848 [Trypanosoma rangeli]|eukprot:RNF05119.1 hypothetical protein TraAM80_04848 [Trypanosoma rangeli]
MVSSTAATTVEQRQPPQQLYQRRQVCLPNVYKTISPCTLNDTPRCVGAEPHTGSLHCALSWGRGPQTSGLVHSPSSYPQHARLCHTEVSLALNKLFLVHSTPNPFQSSALHMAPRLWEQPRFASPPLRHFCHTIGTKVSCGNRAADRAYQLARTMKCWASLTHTHSLGEDLADWKISRRCSDIGALVEFLVLLHVREAENRKSLEQEAASLLYRFEQQERQERPTASLNSLEFPVPQLKSSSIFDASEVNETPKYTIIGRETSTRVAGYLLPRQREDNSRWENRDMTVDHHCMLSDEERAARSLITIVEEGCRRRFVLAAKDGLHGALPKASSPVRSNFWNDEHRRTGREKLKLDETVTNKMWQNNKTPPQKMGLLQSPNAYCESLEESVRGGALSTISSDAFLSVSTGRFLFERLEEDALAPAYGTDEEEEVGDRKGRASMLGQCRNAASGESFNLVTFEEVGSDDPLQWFDESAVKALSDVENERLERAQAGLFYEEQKARAEVLQQEEYGMMQLEERKTYFWLSQHVVDAIALQMENVVREEESRRIYICGNFFLCPEGGTDSSVLSPSKLPPSLHRRFRSGGEQRERDAIRGAFCDGICTAAEAAIAALLEQERHERARLEREAQPKYTSVFWGMELMGERQELLLEEQSERNGIEFAASEHWMDLQLLRNVQHTSLLTGTENMTLSDTQSSFSSRDAEGNVHRWCSWCSDDDVNFSACSLCLSHSTLFDHITRSKAMRRCLSLKSEGNGSSAGRVPQGVQAATEVLEPVCVACTLSTLRAEECGCREALHADWNRGYENLLELDGIATEEFTRAMVLSNTVRMLHAPVMPL